MVKIIYSLAVFGGLVLAILAHLHMPTKLTGLNKLVFLISDYVSIGTSTAMLVLDVAEGVTKADSPKYN